MRKVAFLTAIALVAPLAGCSGEVSETTAVASQAAPDRAKADTANPAAAGSSKIGTINNQRIFLLLGLHQKQIEKHNDLQRELKKLSDEKQAPVKAKLDEYGGDVTKLTDEQKTELQTMDAERIKAVREKQAEVQREMSEFNRYLNHLFTQKLKKPIETVAKRQDLDVIMVWHPNSFAYIGPTVDVTDAVLQELGVDASAVPTANELLRGVGPQPGLPGGIGPAAPSATKTAPLPPEDGAKPSPQDQPEAGVEDKKPAEKTVEAQNE